MMVKTYAIKISHYLKFLDTLYEILSINEKAQAEKFLTADLRNRYIITRAVLRSILAQHLTIEPHNIAFITNSYGKPSIKNYAIQFNMSHSADSAYYAVSHAIELGIDVEWFNEKTNIASIAKSVLNANELNVFVNASDHERRLFFFNIWTIKEAVVKALGMGLSYPMEAINTLEIEGKGYTQIQKDLYYIHKLIAPKGYHAHLVVKNYDPVIIDQQQDFLLLPS